MFDRVGFRRDNRQIFDGLSLDLSERRIGLIGDNGSGKSTLLRLANGLLRAEQGEVLINGRSMTRGRDELQDAVGFVFQNPDHQIIFPTVGEEIAFGLLERGGTPAQVKDQVDALLVRHDCTGWSDRAIHELSEGQKQLVCILAVIATQPSILLLDEPFSSLDLPTRTSLSTRLARLPQHIVMASHDLDLLSDFDRVIWLDKGSVMADGSPGQVLPDYRAHAAARGAAMLESNAE
ncbi:ABC transporter ATP-binding protein [Bradyrhizobium prioriisuperbiae]|uniref:energy-coupling factor ABC transporter ATP-binding protein n=1 Tax=Bradyrhizobium prioriisuperbiae TaxID=2854389 RepID=UPI0028E26634|nr:ABC transporter ATP-binding protein [Bradyrhizobium prioritasuperba]